jgi:hypothetical protein
MKKFFYYAMMLMLAGFTMTSCETDEEIARKLTGVDWEGNLDTYYTNRWGDELLDGEYRTVWRFEADRYDTYGNATHGYGYEADYDLNNRLNRAYSSFTWEVRNGNIYIYYDDRTWNNVRIDYYDYKLTYSRFSGTMYDWEDRIYDFDLYASSTWRWDDYWDSSHRYYTRSADADAEASSDDSIYISDNGKSFATGKFAKALNKMASE